MIRSYKFRLYPSKSQELEMKKHLWLAKSLWNELLAFVKEHYQIYGMFPTKGTMQLMAKNYGMYSQVQQNVAHKVIDAVWRMITLRKKGIDCGFPRFKSVDRMKSLHYPQNDNGFNLGNKLKVTPFGELSIVQHRKIKGDIKTLTIKREPTGKWFAIFTAEREARIRKNRGGKIGIDLGIKTLATLSNGKMIDNPHHLKEHEDKLAFLQRDMMNKKKGSANRSKARQKVALLHETVSNTRKDFLHKASKSLVSRYSKIAMEKLSAKDMSEDGLGKQINDAGWGMFANMISYKAEEAGSEIIFVDPKYTTQECSRCGVMSKKELWDRKHDCPACGLMMDRDVNAAKVILKRATAGHAGCNACGVGTLVPSVKQEANPL